MGKCVVIGLQFTGALEREEELTDFVSTAKGVLQSLVETHFPAPGKKSKILNFTSFFLSIFIKYINFTSFFVNKYFSIDREKVNRILEIFHFLTKF